MPLENEDPKKKAGDLKAPLHLLPTVAMRALAYVLKLGADKYGVYNWRYSQGVKIMTYVAAILRHLFAFVDGEDIDPESGKSHLAHIMATCSILLDAESVGKLIDDRPGVTSLNIRCPECKTVNLYDPRSDEDYITCSSCETHICVKL